MFTRIGIATFGYRVTKNPLAGGRVRKRPRCGVPTPDA